MIVGVLACLAMAVAAQPVQQQPEWEWYLDEVVSETFVGRNYFEYYYTPSAKDMEQQRAKGEVSYFLNSPEGLNSKKVKDMIDRLMASYDDIKAVSEWHVTTGTYWKEFRYDKNKFKFSVKRKALDDGTYYVSVTETAGYYKSLGKGKKTEAQKKSRTATSKPDKRSTRRDRHQVEAPVSDDDGQESLAAMLDGDGEEEAAPVMTEKQRRQQAREQKEAEEMAERARARRAQEKRREDAKALKEAEKQKKAEEKQKKEEEKRLKKEEEKQRREQARREREQERREKAAARKQQASTPKKTATSKYHCNDVALWLSEKYDFTQTSGDDLSCTMFSTVVKDVEMAKLAIKNALKGSNARMAVPWRLNSGTGMVETGYTVDGHVLVFAIGKNEDGNITLTVTEVSADEFDNFKQNLN